MAIARYAHAPEIKSLPQAYRLALYALSMPKSKLLK